MKLAYEKKIEEAKMSHAKTTEPSPSQMKTAIDGLAPFLESI